MFSPGPGGGLSALQNELLSRFMVFLDAISPPVSPGSFGEEAARRSASPDAACTQLLAQCAREGAKLELEASQVLPSSFFLLSSFVVDLFASVFVMAVV